MGADIVIKELNTEINPDSIVGPIGKIISNRLKNDLTRIEFASNYLDIAKTHISDKVINFKNFEEIQSIAKYFPRDLTSFLGFECNLGIKDARVDWALAISGIGKDRQILADVINNGSLPKQFLQQQEWKQINDFVRYWTDTSSILYDKVKCFWLEFDMPKTLPEIPIPCAFFGPIKPSGGTASNDISQYKWLSNEALPLLRGEELSETLEKNFMQCITKMPKNASLFQVGTMLSRSTSAIRLYINRLNPIQILTYLNSIGWIDETGEFSSLVAELEDKADRFVISFDVTENGINPKIGIELSFTGDKFQNETRWEELFDYLVEKGMCLPEKRDALLSYQGVDDDSFSGGIMKPVMSATTHFASQSPSTIARYINHIKIVYQLGQPMDAKAYPAIRLFE